MSADVISIIQTPHFCELHIDQIRTDGRHRTDLGDIKGLASSIEDLGLIHPVVVTPDHQLVAGARRLAAMRALGWDTIPVTVIRTLSDATDRLLAERDENTCRKDFTATELVAVGRRLEELERPKAQERQREGQRRGGEVFAGREALGSVEPKASASTDKIVGDALGVSQSTYKRAKTVVKATDDSNSEVADVARDQLDKLDAGETTYSAADKAVRDARNNGKKVAVDATDPPIDAEVAEPEVIPHLPTKVHGPRPNHHKMLSKIAVQLSGIAMLLDDIEELNDTVNAEEARRLRSDLSQSIRALNRIKRLLQERTK
jgi:ParB-like chromosome segregation protein Spo0J